MIICAPPFTVRQRQISAAYLFQLLKQKRPFADSRLHLLQLFAVLPHPLLVSHPSCHSSLEFTVVFLLCCKGCNVAENICSHFTSTHICFLSFSLNPFFRPWLESNDLAWRPTFLLMAWDLSWYFLNQSSLSCSLLCRNSCDFLSR